MTMHDPLVWGAPLAIAAMTAATLILRTGGFWIMGRLPLTPHARRMLAALPGSIIVAMVLPVVIRGGVAAYAAVFIALVAMLISRNQGVAVIGGVAAAALIRFTGWI